MANPSEERSPARRSVPTPLVPSTMISNTSVPMPTAGGKARTSPKFAPKYVPRLITYASADYQEENWRS